MPTTRQELKNRKPSTEETPTTSEGTATEASGETATGSTATGTVTTDTTERTTTTGTSVPSAVRSDAPPAAPSSATVKGKAAATAGAAAVTATVAAAVARSTTPAIAPTPPAAARQLEPPAARGASATVQGRTQDADMSTVRMKSTVNAQGLKQLQRPSPPSQKGGGSTHSKAKAYKIAKAKEDMLRLQVELAAARLAALEADDTEDELEDDAASVEPEAEVTKRVDNWLENQPQRPVLAITDAPHYAIEEPVVCDAGQQDPPLRSPAGAQPGLTELAEAITRAVKAAQRPKFIELPTFGGSHQEWLPFRAAYYETEGMFTTVENTNRLRRNLKGRAKEAVEGLLITSAHPADVMKTLESRFGRPESIAMMEMETLRGLPRLTESPRDICIFSTKVSNVVATLKTLSCVNYMYNP
ncbi:jg25422, partial [Pararge aegeria aegeria]